MKSPLIPMGAMTGDLSSEEIYMMLKRYKEQGIDSFLIYPRDGCEVPYLSERWLTICEDCVTAAEKLDMDIWLYDEFNWPSGTCKGEVMRQNEEFYAHFINVDEDGNVSIEKTERYSDILNPDAVDLFIKLTHEVYYKRLGKYFGNIIKGIFTDEPSVAYYSYENKYIYYKGMEKDYLEKTGRDLFCDVKNPDEEFDFIYNSIVTERFRNTFAKKIAAWCSEHGILMTGHLMSESDLVKSVRANGNAVKILSEFSLPGIDEIFTGTSLDTAEWLTFGTAQAAIRKKGIGGFIETFALGPTDIPLARVEQMIWLEAMFGIDQFVLAVCAADARGNVKKNGWFNPMNYMNPWFCGYKELSKSAKEAASQAQKKIKAEVAVHVPYDEVSKTIYRNPPYAQQISSSLLKLLKELTRNQYQWILAEEDTENDIPEIAVTGNDFEAEKAVRDFSEKHPRNVIITDEDGRLPCDLFLREFTDGSAVIIDLRDDEKPINLVLTQKSQNKKTSFKLGGRGHIVIPSYDEFVPDISYTKILTASHEFEISLDRANSLRANIRSDCTEFVFRANDTLAGIRILLRKYMPGGDVFFDGKKVNATFPASALTPGISELYLSSEPFTLSRGEHRITISEAAKSEPFLPSCFVVGEFACKLCDGIDILSNLPMKVGVGRLDKEILPQYSGKITYKTKIKVPSTSTHISIMPSELYTVAYIDGENLGGKLRDWIWEIPKEKIGKEVSLTLEQFTSVAPIFGRKDDVVSGSDGAVWTPLKEWFPHKYERVGIENIEFVKEE